MSSKIELDKRIHEKHYGLVSVLAIHSIDVTEWLFNNDNDAAKAVQIWSDVFSRGIQEIAILIYSSLSNKIISILFSK